MTLPPPPSGNGGSQFGANPDPFGQSPQQQQAASWAPQSGGQPPGLPTKKKNNAFKWGLITVALLAVIGVTIALTITFTTGNGGGGGNGGGPETNAASGTSTPGTSPSSTATPEFASANDTGPAAIITEDPTCAAWLPVTSSLAAAQSKVHWSDHDYKIPATEWTPELREMYQTVSNAMLTAAGDAVQLAKKTPHRVFRELYGQFIAYSHAFADSLDTYIANNDSLSGAAINASSTIFYVCEAINNQAAVARAQLVPGAAPSAKIAIPGDPANPERIMTTRDGDCAKWRQLVDKFNADTSAWADLDAKISATDWSPDQQAIIDGVIPIMKKYADDIESLGRGNSNPAISDFAVFSAQYWRAYAEALKTYTKADYYLSRVASRPVGVIVQACEAFSA